MKAQRGTMTKYTFTGMKYIKPNMDKPGSDRWPVNWKGYLYLSGKCGETPFGGMGVSLMYAGGAMRANRMPPRPQYGWYGVYSDKIGGRRQFLRAVTKFLSMAGHGDGVIRQAPIVKEYKFSTPYEVVI